MQMSRMTSDMAVYSSKVGLRHATCDTAVEFTVRTQDISVLHTLSACS